MKTLKGFVIGVVSCVAVAATVAQAGLFSSGVTSGWPTAKSEKYKVEAYGFDIRTYDWERTDGKLCTAMFTDSGPVGLDCE